MYIFSLKRYIHRILQQKNRYEQEKSPINVGNWTQEVISWFEGQIRND